MTRACSRTPNNLNLKAEPAAESATPTAKQTPHAAPALPSLQPALPHTEPKAVASKVYLRLKLENLLLSPKTRKVLAAHNVQTLGQLCRLSANQLATLPGIGAHSLNELHETLDYYGVSLALEPNSRSKGKKPTGPPTLCLPELEAGASSRVCRVCHQPLVSAPTRGSYCSAMCWQAYRSAKSPTSTDPSTPTCLQLALPFVLDD